MFLHLSQAPIQSNQFGLLPTYSPESKDQIILLYQRYILLYTYCKTNIDTGKIIRYFGNMYTILVCATAPNSKLHIATHKFTVGSVLTWAPQMPLSKQQW